jgi:uncharacterized protein YjbI with pentapeptide repeats
MNDRLRPSQADALALLAASREIRGIDFSGLDLRGTRARDEDAPFEFCDCSFDETVFAGLDLRGATFERVSVERADFANAKLDHTVWLTVSGARFDASSARLLGARFERCTLLDADFGNSDLATASFRATRLTGSNFYRARFRDTSFADCHLVATDLRGVSLHKQHLVHVDFADANLAAADLREARLTGCVLRGTKLTGAKLAGTDLRESDLGALTPESCIAMRGAIISSSQAAALVRGLGVQVL